MRSSSHVLLHGPSTQNQLPAALTLPELRTQIAQHCDAKTLGALGQVDVLFRAAVQQPNMWARYYAPASINTSKRTVSTSWRPACSGSFEDVLCATQETLPHKLKTHVGEHWTLSFQSSMGEVYSPATMKILNAVSRMALTGIDRLNDSRRPNLSNETSVNGVWPRSYAFMLDRLFRLDHDLAIPMGTHVAEECVNAAGEIAASFSAFIFCAHKIQILLRSDDLCTLIAHSELVFILYMIFVFSLFVFQGSNRLIRNTFFVPFNHQRLNLWAQQIRRLESAAQAHISAEERQQRGGGVRW